MMIVGLYLLFHAASQTFQFLLLFSNNKQLLQKLYVCECARVLVCLCVSEPDVCTVLEKIRKLTFREEATTNKAKTRDYDVRGGGT